MSIRVVVADDQDLVRTGLVMILGAQPDIDVVGQAADGIQAIEVATRLRPDVLLVDIRMPGLDGVEVTRRLAGPDVADPMAVVVITTFDLDEYVLGALRAGARGFLLKDAGPAELLAGIRAVHSGEAVVAPTATRRLLERFMPSLPTSGAASERAKERLTVLTERETEVLRLVAKGLSYKQIAERLGLSHRTVQNHVQNTLGKLQLHNRVELTRYAIERGLDD